MRSISKEEKDNILDFYFQCGSEEKIHEARDLLDTNSNAAVLY